MSFRLRTFRWIPLLTLAPVLLIGCSSSSTPTANRPSLPPIDTALPASATPSNPGSPSASASSSVSPSTSPSASATASSSSPSASASDSASPSAPPVSPCATSQLSLSLGQGGGAAGSSITPLIFTNTSTTTCTLAGFPGVSFVTGDNGSQVGEAATRNGDTHGTITLQTSGSVMALFQQANAENYPPGQCKETPVRGLRVYPPGQTAALFVALPTGTTACSTQSQGGGQNQSSVQAVDKVS